MNLKKSLFFVLALFYESLVLLRLSLYRHGILRTYHSKKTVISVGNMNAGGSGKTPVVDYLAELLEQQRYSLAILSRGYRRKSAATVQRFKKSEGLPMTAEVLGDEPYLLACRHPNIPVYVGRFRSISAQFAEIIEEPQFLLLDDGYQHIALHRNLNLLLIDAAWDPASAAILPLGDLREPEHHWERADAILITRCNLGFSDRIQHYLSQTLHVTIPVFRFDYQPQHLLRLDGEETLPVSALLGKKILILCGIAHPQSFRLMVEQCGGEVIESFAFKDHHSYSEADIQRVFDTCKNNIPDFCVTTEKDAVKLREFSKCFPNLEHTLWVLQMKVLPDSQWEPFFEDFLRKKCISTGIFQSLNPLNKIDESGH